MEKNKVWNTNRSYWNEKGNDFLGAIVLPLYGAFVSEESCRLFGDVASKKLLEIGCGDGQSLQYQADRGAGELWGVDISEKQLEKARQRLDACGYVARLRCAPMEDDCGIPTGYFDYVYSVYAIGWTTDLDGTFLRIASYLKPGGTFIFSWSHPIHKCIVKEDNRFVFKKSYFDEAWYSPSVDMVQGALQLSDRMLSTYINALVKAGFCIEQMVEQPDETLLSQGGGGGEFANKARQYPATFVIKARKL